MRRAHRFSRLFAVALVAFVLFPAASEKALLGQVRVSVVPPPHIVLPPSYGATPLSTIIHAKAVYVAATGDFLVSAATARLIRAHAAKQEIESSVDWVRAYFQRKEINRQYTRSKNYIERQRDSNQMAKSLIRSDYQVELKTGALKSLNFMLLELKVNALPQRFYPGGRDTLVDSEIDQKLSPDDIHHIRLNDGGAGSARLRFRADEVALKTRWPRVLRVKALETPRLEVEWARDVTVEELKAAGDELSYETSQDLRDKVDALVAAFEAEYPKARRPKSIDTYSEYLAGQRFLQSFAVGVHKMIMGEDQRAFDGSFRFAGDSVADLVAHMHKFGLKFEPRQPGDEGVYEKLFVTMRHCYQRFANGIAV